MLNNNLYTNMKGVSKISYPFLNHYKTKSQRFMKMKAWRNKTCYLLSCLFLFFNL